MMDINSPNSQPDASVQQRIGSLVVKSKGIGQYLKKVAEHNAEDAMRAKNTSRIGNTSRIDEQNS